MGWSCRRRLLLTAAVLYLAQVLCDAQEVQEARPELLRVPAGFNISVYASVPKARQLASSKVGRATIVYVGTSEDDGAVYAVVDKTSRGKSDYVTKLVSGIQTPNGVVVRGKQLFFSGFQDNKGMVWRLDDVHQYALQNKPYTGTRTMVTNKLPGETQHGRRYLRFAPDGLLVFGIGVPCNVCKLDSESGIQFGTLYSLDVDTGELKKLATGIRNSHGHDWHPDTGILYFTDNGRDSIGDNRPDCEVNALTAIGQDFGFPYCQTQGLGNPYRRALGPGVPLPDPDTNRNEAVKNCSAPGANKQPVQTLGPHTAPLGMRFYRWNNASASFPASYNRAMFIVQRGSWNRKLKIGYRVMLLRLGTRGRPAVYRPFATGWLQNEGNATTQHSWGRPVDVDQLPDGSLLVSDDGVGLLYRITFFRR
eukprot:GHRR01009486.1.p1 GENE.GHRR01009486.1~~GHRR01009486.1.p1  ORF type:complete len:421 (+),score=96.65 GHRR01009486.1:228-1490(+)